MTIGSKLTSLEDAIRAHVQPGMHVNFASTPSRSNAGVRAIARAFRARNPRFVISATGFHSAAHLLPLLRLGRKYVACFFGDNYPVPRPNGLYASVVAEGAELEMWSLWSYVSALRAGALGHAYAFTRSLGGTDMARDLARAGAYREIFDPESAEPMGLVRAMRPDVTFVHAPMGDAHGTLVFGPPYSEGLWGAHGARSGVIATVERLVSTETCARFADAVKLPSARVLAVCEEPFGAHPQPLYVAPRFADVSSAGYVDDFAHYDLWREISASEALFAELGARVLDAKDGARAYRDWVGADRLEHLAAEATAIRDAICSARAAGVTPSPRRTRTEPPPSDDSPTSSKSVPPLGPKAARTSDRPDAPARANEIVVVLAARKIAARVRAKGYPFILAGIGQAFIAARMAKLLLEGEGIDVRVIVETGLFDLECGKAGDEFLLSYRNIALSKHLGGVEDVLGTLTCGAESACLGVVGAAQIDATGAINSTRIGGKLLVGSGGANDIASCAAELVVLTRCDPSRLVHKVDYVTSPGRSVLTVATDMCTFTRSSAAAPTWVLEDLYPGLGGRPPPFVIEAIRESCPWPWTLGEGNRARALEEAEYAPLISTAEMALYYDLDPDGLHWRRRPVHVR